MAAPLEAISHWEADVLLLDGGTARIRPVRPDDADLLVALFDRLSDEAKYLRFMAPKAHLSDYEVQRYTVVDFHTRVVLVATLGDEMIGMGSYDLMDDDEAEVAFLVDDAQQGRGLGALLLEHLAQAGRERGINRFVAEVLPENGKMIWAFRAAGYAIKRGIAQGLFRYEFPVLHTETSVEVMRAREHRAESRSMQRLLTPRSVAVIGASAREHTMGRRLVHNLVAGGFTGPVRVVHPRADAVIGVPAYPTIGDVPGPVDLAIIVVPADRVPEVVLECAQQGVHGLIVVSSGFAEAGREGRDRQHRLLDVARSHGMRLVGPNCLGVINTDPEVSLNATVASPMPSRGRIGFFAQSGALGMAILRNVGGRGLGLSSLVSAGNRADVSGNDLLQYWEEDPSTELVLLYLESIGNPRKFYRIARRVSAKKPVVAVKTGRATQGVPLGHSVRRSEAPAAAWDAMFLQAGVIQVDTLDEMFDVATLLAHQPLPAGPRVAVISNSGEILLLAIDALLTQGLVVDSTQLLHVEASGEQFEEALRTAMARESADAVFAVYIPPLEQRDEGVTRAMAAVGRTATKPLLTTFLGQRGVPEQLRVADASGGSGRGSVPSYQAPEMAARALAHAVRYGQWVHTPATRAPVFTGVEPHTAKALVQSWLEKNPEGGYLDGDEATALLATFRIRLTPSRVVRSLQEALDVLPRIDGPAVLKATQLTLRRDRFINHLRTGIVDAKTLTQAWDSLLAEVGDPVEAHLVVQGQSPVGVPVTIATIEDPAFGPIVSVGLSGPSSELLHDVAYGIPPLTEQDAKDMLGRLKAAPLLYGYDGSQPLDVAGVEDLLHRVGQLNEVLAEMAHLQLAVLVGIDSVTPLWARIRLAHAEHVRADGGTRRLTAPAAHD